MKVVFTSYYQESAGGGEAQVVYETAHALAAKYTTAIICPGKKNTVKKEKSGLCKIEIKSYGKAEFLIPLLEPATVRFLFNALRQFAPDIIHAQSPDPISFIVQTWALINKVPFIFTAHELPTKISEFGINEYSKYLVMLLDLKITKSYFLSFFSNCDAIIALNKSVLTDLSVLNYRGKTFVVPNGRNLNAFHHCRIPSVKHKNIELIYIGWLSERKNQKFLIDMMACLPSNYKLTLVGSAFNPAYQKKLEIYIASRGLKNIHFSGQVVHSAIPRFLERSRVFVSASKMEVMSLTIIEALASGTPVVSLSNETTDELIDNAVGALLPKNCSPREFAVGVMKICALDQIQYNDLCAGARRKVDHLDLSKIVEQIVGAYQIILREKNGTDGRIEKIVSTISALSILETRNFIIRYALKTLGGLKRKKLYRRLMALKGKTKKPYRFVPLVILLTLSVGFSYKLLNNILAIKKEVTLSKIRKKLTE